LDVIGVSSGNVFCVQLDQGDFMSRFTDETYLLNEQYKTPSHLTQRATLHDRFSTSPRRWMLWLFDQYDLPNDAKILELGCGPGWLWKENLERIPEGWDIVLSDFSPGMLVQARENVAGRPCRFERIDAQEIPFEDETFDAVFANHMLYHVPDRSKAFSEICRVLKPGGFFYAATNGKNHMQELRDMVVTIQPDAYEELSTPNFGLENGAEQLSPYFGDVEVRLNEDALCVTALDPLMDYVASGKRLTEPELDAVRNLAQRRLVEEGAIVIEKSVGVFIARKAT